MSGAAAALGRWPECHEVPADPALQAVHRSIAAYYSERVRRFGATPAGADWTCVASQHMRFVQLLRLCGASASFLLNDLGCGHGALLALLEKRYAGRTIDYLGVDLSAAMLRHARRQWRGHDSVRFVAGSVAPRQADYAVASGVFNVSLDHPTAVWEAFVSTTLDGLAATSRRGFAVNFLLPPPVGLRAKPGLYTTTPEPWAEYCRRRFNAETEIIGGYGLREFTLIARPKTQR